MKHLFTLALLLPFCSTLSAQDHQYQSTCSLRDGRAYGYINNFRDALTVDGEVWFHFYDCNGNFLSSEDEWEYEYVSDGSREEIEYTRAPSGACSCEFHPESAVREVNDAQRFPPACPSNSFSTSCKMVDGYGRGYLAALNSDITVDGTVWFYFYDCNGDFLGSEDESEYEYVSRGDQEEVEYSRAPSGSCTCVFEVKGAIRQ
jgi:hypothetical protein